MLLTSRGTKRWVTPKGWPIAGLTPQDAAAREAYEEAGLVGGVAHERPIGTYRYEKRLGSGRTVTCEVTVYVFRVDRQLGEWPEKGQRRTRWFVPADAAALVAEDELAVLLRGIEPQVSLCERGVKVLDYATGAPGTRAITASPTTGPTR